MPTRQTNRHIDRCEVRLCLHIGCPVPRQREVLCANVECTRIACSDRVAVQWTRGNNPYSPRRGNTLKEEEHLWHHVNEVESRLQQWQGMACTSCSAKRQWLPCASGWLAGAAGDAFR